MALLSRRSTTSAPFSLKPILIGRPLRNIVGNLVHLGVWFGPAATSLDQWNGPAQKLLSRTIEIAGSGAHFERCVELYVQRALPVLSYKAQLLFMPRAMAVRERMLFARLMHAPCTIMSHPEWFELQSWGLPRLPSILSMNAAALMRCSLATLSTWQAQIARLRTAVVSHGPTAWWQSPRHAPEFFAVRGNR